jgi:hypothetical protein
MVAVRDESGRWHRAQQDAQSNEQQSHGHAFYQLWLAQNHLPPWFLHGLHTAMLSDAVEARRLGVEVPTPVREGRQRAPTEEQQIQHRSMLRGVHVAGGGIVNPTQIPAGVGRWEWLDSTDREVAVANGFGHSFEDVTNARAAGALSLNPDRQDGPSVVWYPDPHFFNPNSQPVEPGHWAFLTSDGRDSDEGFASLNLGGTSGMSNHPTASQIFRLRQQYRAQRREDLTEGIRIVWIPGEDASDSEGDDPVLQPFVPADGRSVFFTGETPENSEEGQERQEKQGQEEPNQPTHGVLGPGILPSDFDPTNANPGGKTDQTARLCPPRYYTFRIAGRVVTLDRARPQVGKVEEHKTIVFTEEGWRQHTGHIELDWTSQEVVASLARWRDQAAKRNGWPQVRPEPRVPYAEDEKAWVKARVHGDLDAGRDYDIVETRRGFLEKFGHRRERTEGGISGIMLRIKREWRKIHPTAVLLRRQQDEEDSEGEEEEEGEEAAESEDEDHANEEMEELDELDDEEAALAAETEALERENAAEDEAMAKLQEERSLFVEQDREEGGQQGGGGGVDASPDEPSGEHSDSENEIN